MADSDPISEGTPHKRRRLNDGSRRWDSGEDSSEEFTVEDFETAATLPLSQAQNARKQLQYTQAQFRRDVQGPSSSSSGTNRPSSPSRPYITQPTQTLNTITQPTQTLGGITQPTQPLPRKSQVLVDRSSPTLAESSSPRQQPQPIRRAFARPSGGLLASAMAPPGTSFRKPLGIQSQPASISVDSDEEEDPPVHYSSDEETQGASLKPTNFKKGGRGLDSTPNRGDRVVKESPRPGPNEKGASVFTSLLAEFNYNSSSSSKPADDMASSYGSSPRQKRPSNQLCRPTGPSYVNGQPYNTLDDIDDYVLRSKVMRIQDTLRHESVQRCMDALLKRKAHVEDAIDFLTQDEEKDAPGEEDELDELASTTPVAKRGVAVGVAKAISQSSQPVRPAAKQEVKAPTRTIAEKYTATQAARKQSIVSQDEDDVKPRRRLQQGRKARSPSPLASSPLLKPPPPVQRLKTQPPIVISDEENDSDSGVEGQSEEDVPADNSHEKRLLKFFNECTIRELADLSAQPEDVLQVVLGKRPFASLDVIRTISNVTETKSGKKSKTRAVGERIVDVCSEVLTGYDAIDDLVEECERIAKPIQEALKGWGVGSSASDGELNLMNLDEAHDSGIGTPTSSCPSDEPAPRKQSKSRGFLDQPESMSKELTLKDFQLVGLNWLNLLYQKGISCVLADDMGLGKTCQVIAFLAHLQEQKVNGVSLVIVPGSTLENWLREFARFAPELSVRPYYGTQLERPQLQYQIEQDFDTIDVIVTTYDMAVKPDDNKFLRKTVDPLICIYDEAHALRNPQSNRYDQLTRIRADHRVLLTGTPLQNNLQELIAILAFIMPALFKEKYEDLKYIFQHKASTKDTEHTALLSTQRIARARSMMTPFILRRKKANVLELPTKHSRVEYCDMTQTQMNYYEGLKANFHQMFDDKAQGKRTGAKASSNMLMSLRKAAIHPLLELRLYDDKTIDKIVTECIKHKEFGEKNTREDIKAYLSGEHAQSFKGGDYALHCYCNERPYLKKFALKKSLIRDSGKIVVFRRLVSDFVANGDRILVFSQFTTMMDILDDVLETLDIKFMRLDGSTPMPIRQEMIDQFTNDESIKVFMLSTKAGGAGINLASANKVIIFDSGFNPQDDVQAENRAHRVGQTREVEVVRLVTRGTIEVQIHALGESKLALDERVAGEGATAAEEKLVDKRGEQLVLEDLERENKGEKRTESKSTSGPSTDLRDVFKTGLQDAGLSVASRQAQF